MSDTETIERLRGVSVATLATALYKRGLRSQTVQGARPVGPRNGNMVGPAFTLRTIPAREDRNDLSVFRDPMHPQRHAVETCPPGAVLVVDSRKDARAASAGDILVRRLLARGCEGIVTDGGFRDSHAITGLAIHAYHARPSPPTNLTLHECIAIDEPIGCGDAPVFPGDIMVGDADAVIVVPRGIAEEVSIEAVEMTAYEDFVAERVDEGHAIIGLYPLTKDENRAAFEAWRERNGR